MKLISWNVNGIRACIKNGFEAFVQNEDSDILCVQETKAGKDDVGKILQQFPYQFWNSAEKKGYAGTATFSKIKPKNVLYGFECKATDEEDKEGRILIAEFDTFFHINTYTMNSQRGLTRLKERQAWDKKYLELLTKLDKQKPCIICGDLNVAHTAIDLANPKSNYNKTAGYTQAEIDGFTTLLNAGFIDTFRHFNKQPGQYTWWSYMFNARAKNIGWRIDYFLASERFMKQVQSSDILPQITGSDHCPVRLVIE